MTSSVAALPALGKLPEGAELKASGDIDTMGDIFSSFATAITAGVLTVYLLLVLLFRSFVTPITILAALPLAIGGAIFALWIYGAEIGLSVAIGFMMLMGIVTKNSIMLVEFALEQVGSGTDRHEAILDAAHKRAWPIVMTTLVMSAGMMPSALGHGLGGEFRAPMAIAVIGGLLVSTVLTLLFVPALYSVIEQLRDFLRRQLDKVFYREMRENKVEKLPQGEAI